PTYADVGYNIDTLADGTKLATIDSLGSQANRLEPIFKSHSIDPSKWLVPQLTITLREGVDVSVLDLAHRGADAVVMSSPGLRALVEPAFEALHAKRDAWSLAALVPTSLVFGVWDSRGGTGEKRPRVIRSIVRAHNVEPLHTAAQYNSIWKQLDDTSKDDLQKEAKKKKAKLSEQGLADAPSVFRKGVKVHKYVDDAPNPEARVLGGVLVHGDIERSVTINLVALRALRGEDTTKTAQIRRYVLGLALLAATEEIELFLREGCLLRYKDEEDSWWEVPRRGEPKDATLPDRSELREWLLADGSKPFRDDWPESTTFEFDIREAKKLLAKKAEDVEEA
ncbi:MAG: type I-U CRISPR-associated RAMP protein Csb1/Cas7u, partial [Myxococcota bacterium]